MTREEELEAIISFTKYIDKRMYEGASVEELDKLYEDLHSLQQNYYLGELLGEE